MLGKIWLHKQSWTNINQNLISLSYPHRSHLTNSSDSYDPNRLVYIQQRWMYYLVYGEQTLYSYYSRTVVDKWKTWHILPIFDMYFSLVTLHLGLLKASHLPSDYLTMHLKMFLKFSQLPKEMLPEEKVKFRDASWRTNGVLEMVIYSSF